MAKKDNKQPAHAKVAPRWTSSAKSGVGTAASRTSRIWFTLSHGIVDEVYHPTVDQADIRDLGFIVTGPDGFFSEEKRDSDHEIAPLAPGTPGYCMVSECQQGRYRLSKTIYTDPDRDVLIQEVRFKPLKGKLADYRVYALLAPHIANLGEGNSGWVGDYKGEQMLFARRKDTSMALACSAPWLKCGCGYVGETDGWTDIRSHGEMRDGQPNAGPGNIALTGEIDIQSCNGQFNLVLAIDEEPEDAGQQARATLVSDIDAIKQCYIAGWKCHQDDCVNLDSPKRAKFDTYQTSVAVLRTHEDKQFPGGIIASLSFPWGFSQGDGDRSGYHMVWPRDQVEAAGALLACGQASRARETLIYLMATQAKDGHWPQNMWLNGKAQLGGLQSDETAFPILLADLLKRHGSLNNLDVWPAIRKAAAFLAQKGPSTAQDRWEENSGISVFTLAVAIAALLAAADFADDANEPKTAEYLRETADIWNSQVENWTYVSGTDLAKRVGVDGYYIRIAPRLGITALPNSTITLKNLAPGQDSFPASEVVSPDALALVRFGLRAADDPRIVNTVKVLDSMLKTETKTGPGWHRYNHDGYGEHEDGAPFDGVGVGRVWPLLAGERAHYELAAGNRSEAARLLEVMAAQTSPGALLPEQVWDSDDIPERELYNGQPSGSGMPLVWAHAEYIKLIRSLKDRKIFDMPAQPQKRYLGHGKKPPKTVFWRFNYQLSEIPANSKLRIELKHAAVVHWTMDHWKSAHDSPTRDTGLGLHGVDLPTDTVAQGQDIEFTFRWRDSDSWEDQNFTVRVGRMQ